MSSLNENSSAAALHFVVRPEDAADRLDVIVPRTIPGLSRAVAAALIESGAVRVNGRACKAATRPIAGARLDIQLPPAQASAAIPEHIPLSVVYEDTDIVVVDKPAGMVVHPAPGHERGTLVNALLGRYSLMEGDPARPGIVHRLDRDTSGLIVVGRTQQAITALSRAFKNRDVHKEYLALVVGTPKPASGAVSAEIGRDPRHRQRMAVVANGGRDARTTYETIATFKHFSLVKVTIETGRMHQIRVHFGAMGHPIVGDVTYGRPIRDARLKRQFLHAARLRFRHPVTGDEMEFRSELPPDLASLLHDLQSTAETSTASIQLGSS
jgi:23S rRNA pseudouridine1911/1915/1917 synthase